MIKNKKGFTLVELLTVIMILAVLMVIAVPSIMAIIKKLQDRSLVSKLESLQESAAVYVQNNSNKIKKEIDKDIGACNRNVAGKCECASGNTDCKYIVEYKVKQLIELGAIKSEKADTDSTSCNISDPSNEFRCLDCLTIAVKLDDDHKSTDGYFRSFDGSYKRAVDFNRDEEIPDKNSSC